MKGDTIQVKLDNGKTIRGYEYPIAYLKVAISAFPIVEFESFNMFWKDYWSKEDKFIAQVDMDYVPLFRPRLILTERIIQ